MFVEFEAFLYSYVPTTPNTFPKPLHGAVTASEW